MAKSERIRFAFQVTIRLLEGPETTAAKGNFLPSWLYWLQLPRYCQIPRNIVLQRPGNGTGSLGFSIVGGNNAPSSSSAGDGSGNSPHCDRLVVDVSFAKVNGSCLPTWDDIPPSLSELMTFDDSVRSSRFVASSWRKFHRISGLLSRLLV